MTEKPAVAELLQQYPGAPVTKNEYYVNQKDFAKHVRKRDEDGIEGGSIGIVWLPDGTLPLVRRTHTWAGWALPGGSLERGDTYKNTFIKEMGEELGVKLVLDSIRLVLIEHQIHIAPDGQRFNQTLATFAADVLPGDVPHQTEDTVAEGLTIGLFSPESLPELIFSDHDKIMRAIKIKRQ